MARTINMHTDLQICSCWEHISMTSWKKDKTIMGAEVSTHTFLTMIIEECLFHVVWTNFVSQLFLCGTHGIYIYIFFINWTLYERPISWNFFIKYFHLICHLILTQINCITLKIRSKADFKSKSQNIYGFQYIYDPKSVRFSIYIQFLICVPLW
jgi:hypothetical protein